MNESNTKAYNNWMKFKTEQSIILRYDAVPQGKSICDILEEHFREVRNLQIFRDAGPTFL